MNSPPTRHAQTPRLVNLSELNPKWRWLQEPFREEIPDWHHVTTQAMRARLPIARTKQARWLAVQSARRLLEAHAGARILVSHGPRPASYWGAFASGSRVDAHDVISFNFTDMPTSLERRFISRALRGVSEFVVSSRWEQPYYADYFDIPESRIRFQHWGVRIPDPRDPDERPLIEGDYLCALGSQARDYATLVDAMRLCPGRRLVIVATPACVAGIDMPPNVEFRTNIPLDQAMNILAHSQLMVLPMNSTTARCGHVTVVSALHMGIPTISTDCRGLDDYFPSSSSAGTAVPQGDSRTLASAIDAMCADPAMRRRLSAEGQAFALAHCTEEAVFASFRRSLVARGLLRQDR